jgi:hypothetical protein
MEKYNNIMRLKRDMPVSEIAKDLPIEFEDLLLYSRALKF